MVTVISLLFCQVTATQLLLQSNLPTTASLSTCLEKNTANKQPNSLTYSLQLFKKSHLINGHLSGDNINVHLFLKDLARELYLPYF